MLIAVSRVCNKRGCSGVFRHRNCDFLSILSLVRCLVV